MIVRVAAILALALAPQLAAAAEPAPFDLSGPGLRVTVARGGTSLPITQVPNLSAGDRIAIAAVLPQDQGARYILVAAFLRGATNPPPKNWFYRAETWQKKKNSLDIVVPEGARQLVLFLAPQTGGDFGALVDAVRGQPGAFVRVTQDLNQASLDRARLDAYIDAIRRQDRSGPEGIGSITPILTQSLTIKLNKDCLDQAPDLQAACLMQSRDSLVLADGHTSSLTETVAATTADLALQLSATPQGGLGYYSPYIGVVRDLARIFGAFQSTHFRYIPALVRFESDQIALLLNAVPSFDKPKSALVVAMPAIEPAEAPPLRAGPSAAALCAVGPGAVLAVEGAPLVYATGYAHDMALRVRKKDGSEIDVPVKSDPSRGGYVLGDAGWQLPEFGATIDATLHGRWGFVPFEGPRFRLQNPDGTAWRPAGGGIAASVVVGRENSLDLEGAASACVDGITLTDGSGATQQLSWKADGADHIVVAVPLVATRPGKLNLAIQQRGSAKPQDLSVTALSEAARLDSFTLHAGDTTGTLRGNRLDMVSSVTIDALTFAPGDMDREGKTDALALVAQDTAAAAALTAGQDKTARIILSDGRRLRLNITIAAPRTNVRLIAKTIVRPPAKGPLPIVLSGDSAVAQDAQLNFSIGAAPGGRFTGAEEVEIATVDGRASTKVTARDGLTLQNAQVAVVSVEPGALLGNTAYGPLQFRVIQNDVASDWVPLATLVRLPVLNQFACKGASGACEISGRGLFLIDRVAKDENFGDAVVVPEGFTGTALTIPPRPAAKLFLRFRDDPSVTGSVTRP